MPQFSRRFNVLWQVAARDIAAEDAAAALSEDIGDGDISAGLVLANTRGTGLLYARESAVLCGREWFEECFLQLDTTAEFVWHAEEGGDVTPGMIVGETRAGFRALLGGERSALMPMLVCLSAPSREYLSPNPAYLSSLVGTALRRTACLHICGVPPKWYPALCLSVICLSAIHPSRPVAPNAPL